MDVESAITLERHWGTRLAMQREDSEGATTTADSPSGFALCFLLSIGECVLDAGRGICGEVLRCATAADIPLSLFSMTKSGGENRFSR